MNSGVSDPEHHCWRKQGNSRSAWHDSHRRMGKTAEGPGVGECHGVGWGADEDAVDEPAAGAVGAAEAAVAEAVGVAAGVGVAAERTMAAPHAAGPVAAEDGAEIAGGVEAEEAVLQTAAQTEHAEDVADSEAAEYVEAPGTAEDAAESTGGAVVDRPPDVGRKDPSLA